MAMSHQQRTTLKMLCEYLGRLEMTFWLIASIQKCCASKKNKRKKTLLIWFNMFILLQDTDLRNYKYFQKSLWFLRNSDGAAPPQGFSRRKPRYQGMLWRVLSFDPLDTQKAKGTQARQSRHHGGPRWWGGVLIELRLGILFKRICS